MGFLGRESDADRRRAESVRRWATARNPNALFATMFGILAVIDSITMVIGLASGVVAIVLAIRGRRQLQQHPEQKGERLCIAALCLGVLGIVLSVTVWFLTHRGT
jgi:hypothetical protein